MIENDVQPELEEPLETFHIYPMGDGFFVRKEAAAETVIDSEPPVKPQQSDHHDAILMLVSSLIMALFVIFVPSSPIAAQITLVHTFRLSDLRSYSLLPVTASRSITVATTGKGRQSATRSRGVLTFYNGSFSAQVIPQDMIFTTGNGVQIVTDEAITIPAANPPLFGQADVSAHGLNAGTAGNIPAYTIDTACCALSMKVVNTSDFTGGKNTRDYHVVTQQDIVNGASPLTQSLYSQEQKALHTELTHDAALIRATCSSTVTSNRHPGEEAARVTIHVAAICSGIAYSRRALQERARQVVPILPGFLLQAMSVNVVRTTPTSVIVSIQCSMVYNFQQKRKEWKNEN